MGLGRLLQRQNETVTGLTVTDYAKMFSAGGVVNYAGRNYQAYEVSGSTVSPGADRYGSNAVVFACEMNRVLLFSEARFQWQQLRGGRPGDLFGTAELATLEAPWVGAQTRDLLSVMELDVFQAGNSYWVADGAGLLRLDPANVVVVTEGAFEPVSGVRLGERLVGYAYRQPGVDRVATFAAEDVAHYHPVPSASPFLGMSWLNPCLPDLDADQQLTEHKRTAMRRGTNIPYVVTLDASVTDEQFQAFVEHYRATHEGPENAGKTLFLGGGADVKTVGQSFEQLSLKATQGAGETRIAACAGVPPVIVGLSEGLASATYSNYGQARRRLVDGTMRPLWGAAAGALASVLTVPTGSRLWYDDRDIPFLREDVTDQAGSLAQNAATVRALIEAGFAPDSVVDAVEAGDLRRLSGQHSGLTSVQLQPPVEAPSTNGNGSIPAAV